MSQNGRLASFSNSPIRYPRRRPHSSGRLKRISSEGEHLRDKLLASEESYVIFGLSKEQVGRYTRQHAVRDMGQRNSCL
jgi:hypothetical protein